MESQLLKRALLLTFTSFVLSSCILNITADSGGNVHQGSEGGKQCDPSCTIDTSRASGEAFFAVADAGFEFSHWKGATTLCVNDGGNICVVNQQETGEPLFDEFNTDVSAVVELEPKACRV